MSSKDAYMFPVYGSMALFSIYLCYKFLPKEWLNIVFTCHFTFIGWVAVAGLLEFPVSKFAKPNWKDITVLKKKFNLNLILTKKEIDLNINYLEAVCLAIAIFPAI